MPPLLDPADDHDRHIASRLATATVAWLATVRPGGRPHAVPVWFGWADPDAVVFTQPGSQKVRNLRAASACTLAPESAERGKDIVFLEGTAELLPPDEAPALGARTGFDRKYAPLMGEGGFSEWVQRFPQPVVVRVERIVAWGEPGGTFRFKTVAPRP